MIEARVDTIIRGVEHVGGGLQPAEIATLKKRVRKNKKVCRGEGCITRISAYNRDHRGHPETLCYKCRSREGYPTREYTYEHGPGQENKRRDYTCKNGHDKAEVGTTDRGGCLQCATDSAKGRYERTLARRADPNHVRKDSRLALWGLAGLIEERGVSLKAIERKTGIPGATIGDYARVVGTKGYKCPPDRAELIANYLRVSVEELCGASFASEAGEEQEAS